MLRKRNLHSSATKQNISTGQLHHALNHRLFRNSSVTHNTSEKISHMRKQEQMHVLQNLANKYEQNNVGDSKQSMDVSAGLHAQQIQQYKQQIASMKMRIQKLEQNQVTNQPKRIELEEQVNYLTKKLTQANAKIQDMNNKLIKNNKEFSEMTIKFNQAKSQILFYEQQIQSYKNKTSRCSSRTTINRVQVAQFNENTAFTSISIQNQPNNLTANKAINTTFNMQQFCQLEIDIRNLKQQLSDKKQENSRLKQNMLALNSGKKTDRGGDINKTHDHKQSWFNEQLETVHKQWQKDRQSLRSQLQVKTETIQNLQNKYTLLQKQLKTLENTAKKTQQNYNQLENTHKSLEQNYNIISLKLKNQQNYNKQQNKSQQASNCTLNTQIQELKNETKLLQSQLQHQKQHNKQLEKLCEQSTKMNNDNLMIITTLEVQLQQKKALVKQLEDQSKQKYQKQANLQQGKYAELLLQKQKIELELRKAQKMLECQVCKSQELQKLVECQQNKLIKKQKEKQELMGKMEKELQQLSQQYSEILKDNDSKQTTIELHKIKQSEFRAEINSYEMQLEKWKGWRQENISEFQQLRTQVRSYKSKINELNIRQQQQDESYKRKLEVLQEKNYFLQKKVREHEQIKQQNDQKLRQYKHRQEQLNQKIQQKSKQLEKSNEKLQIQLNKLRESQLNSAQKIKQLTKIELHNNQQSKAIKQLSTKILKLEDELRTSQIQSITDKTKQEHHYLELLEKMQQDFNKSRTNKEQQYCKKIKELKIQIEAIQADKSFYVKQTEKYRKQVTVFERLCQQKETEIQQYYKAQKMNKQRNQSGLKNYQHRIDELEQTVNELESQRWKLQQSLKQKQREFVRLQTQCKNYEIQLQTTSNHNQTLLQSETAKLSALIQYKNKQIQNLLQVNYKSNQQTVALEAEAKDLKSKLQQRQKQFESHCSTDMQLMKRKTQILQLQNFDLKQQSNTLKQRIKNQEKEINEIRQLQKQNHKKRQQIYLRISEIMRDFSNKENNYQFSERQEISFLESHLYALKSLLVKNGSSSTAQHHLQSQYKEIYRKYQKYKEAFLSCRLKLQKQNNYIVNDRKFTEDVISNCKVIVSQTIN